MPVRSKRSRVGQIQRPKGNGVVGIRYGTTTLGYSGLPDPVSVYARNAHVFIWGPNKDMLDLLPQIRAENPEMLILVYSSVFRAAPGSGWPVGGLTTPNSSPSTYVNRPRADAHDNANPNDRWVLRNNNGLGLNEPTYVLLDPGRPSFQQECLTNALDWMADYPELDGVYWDEQNSDYQTALVSMPAGESKVAYAAPYPSTTPLYPTEGRNSLWEQKMIEFYSVVGAGIRSHISPRGKPYYIMTNVGAQGNWYDDPSYGGGRQALITLLAPYVDGFLYEWALQSPNVSPGASDGDPTPYPMMYSPQISPAHWTGWWDHWVWRAQYDQSLGKDLYFGNTLTQQLAGGSVADDRRKMIMNRAAYLLFWNGLGHGGQYWWFRNTTTVSPFDQRYTNDPGIPAEDPPAVIVVSGGKVAQPRGGVNGRGFRRYWTKCVAMVNPHPTLSETFNLNGSYTSLDDGSTASSFTLAPKTGLVAIK